MKTVQIEKQFDLSNKFWYLVALVTMAISILRGIRFPNMWSYSHFLFNYDFGFVKRSLLGAIISQFDSAYLRSYEFFLVLSMIIFVVNVLLLYKFVRDLIDSTNPVLIGATVIFSSSLAVVVLSHFVGYSDQIGLLITLVSLRINGFYRKLLFLIISMPFALLIHEAIMIIFFPIMFMSLILSIDRKEPGKQLFSVVIFSAFTLILVFIMSKAGLDEGSANQLYNDLQSKVEYSLRDDAFYVLFRDSEDNLALMEDFWDQNRNIKALLSSLLVTAPAFIFINYLMTKILIESRCKYYLISLSVLASLSPLVLHFFWL